MLEGITKALTDSFKVISGNAKITEANIYTYNLKCKKIPLPSNTVGDIIKK